MDGFEAVPVRPSLVMVDGTALSWGAKLKLKVEEELDIQGIKLFGFHASPVRKPSLICISR